LAIILFEYLLLDPSFMWVPKLPSRLKNPGVHEPPAPYFLRLWAHFRRNT